MPFTNSETRVTSRELEEAGTVKILYTFKWYDKNVVMRYLLKLYDMNTERSIVEVHLRNVHRSQKKLRITLS
jgi:hypothetical protein